MIDDPENEQPDQPSPDAAPDFSTEQPPPEVTAFYEGAIARVRLLMLVFGLAAVTYGAIIHGLPIALGILAGGAVAYLNFVWLKIAVTHFADRLANTGGGDSGTGVVARFMLRYGLIGIGAYVILHGSPGSLYGFLGGLLLPVPAILCEAVYELVVALRRGL